MIFSGLVSITFRQLNPRDIIELVSCAGLNGIEWGGDIHVPHGDIKTAKEVLHLTIESGLSVSAYGSYYKVGCVDRNFENFKKIVETGVALKAPTIRVWAGEKISAAADIEYRKNVVEGSRLIADIAKKAGITISFEFHSGTLMDTNESAIQFLKEINHNYVKTYWQPNLNMDIGQKLEGLKWISPMLTNIHVFYWAKDDAGNTTRNPLRNGEKDWKIYFNYIHNLPGYHYAMIEHVKNDEPDQFLEDAKVLKDLIRNSSMQDLNKWGNVNEF